MYKVRQQSVLLSLTSMMLGHPVKATEKAVVSAARTSTVISWSPAIVREGGADSAWYSGKDAIDTRLAMPQSGMVQEHSSSLGRLAPCTSRMR
jgi:hypothetical protein